MEEEALEVQLFPLFLKLAGRTVLVVGAGVVATGKVASLLAAGAAVRLVAPEATETLTELSRAGRLDFRQRVFAEGDLDGIWLAFTATSDAAAQRAVGRACAARRVFCVAVDDPPNASAYSGSVVRRAPFTVAISSSGAAPALTRLVRELVEHVLPEQDWVAHALRLRERWLADGTPMANRFAELLRELAARAG